MKKIYILFLLLISFILPSIAQDVLKWDFSIEKLGDKTYFVANVKISSGYHLYDTNIPSGGPNATSLTFDKISGAEAVGKFESIDKKATVKFDPIFNLKLGTFEGAAKFVQELKITDASNFILEGDVRAQACSNTECTPPIPVDFHFDKSNLPEGLLVESKTNESKNTDGVTKTSTNNIDKQEGTNIQQSVSNNSDLWLPVIDKLKDLGMKGDTKGLPILLIFIYGFFGGLLALLTPCVWPIIPMTVSFFLKRNKNNSKKAISESLTYGISIILIYLILGLAITIIFGSSALNDLSTNAFFNLLFFGLLVLFGISFLGGFEITLPASWTSKLDQKADKASGIISILFMAFTLALVSFSCTGPIIGTLLVEAAVSGGFFAPAVGMLGFAIALSIPFTLFALFPSWLQKMPKSGGWLNVVKVVLGFLELALALKFLSVADLAYGWRILDREVFLVLWIVLFALLGLYLLGKLKFSHDSDVKHVSIPRFFMALASLAFAIYLVPGLWGAPLKTISAFSPPLTTQDFSLYNGEVIAKYTDYDEGMAYAKQVGKPVLIDFSGYGCVNCRKMEASVWTDIKVKDILDNDYVLITLLVDDKKQLPDIIRVNENGRNTKIKTIGDKWSYLQRSKFGTNSQPYYVALDNQGNPIAPSYAYDENVQRYLDFLHTGLDNFKK